MQKVLYNRLSAKQKGIWKLNFEATKIIVSPLFGFSINTSNHTSEENYFSYTSTQLQAYNILYHQITKQNWMGWDGNKSWKKFHD